jgi:hypothetical protein
MFPLSSFIFFFVDKTYKIPEHFFNLFTSEALFAKLIKFFDDDLNAEFFIAVDKIMEETFDGLDDVLIVIE